MNDSQSLTFLIPLVHPVHEDDLLKTFPRTKRMVMRSFRDDCREAYVISNSYGMGDPLAFRFREAGRTAEGGG